MAIFKNFCRFRYYKNYKNIDVFMHMRWPFCARWAYRSGTDVQTEHTHQFLMRMLSMCISFPIFPMFILYISSAYTLGTDACTEPVFLNVYGAQESIPRNEFRQLCSLAGRYNKPIPPRFLAPIGCLKIPAQSICVRNWSCTKHTRQELM